MAGNSFCPAARPRARGFALVITLGLLTFLLLLLLALATLTRVEAVVSTSSQRHIQAQQNALMALNIAIGRLQKYAGSDTRITATAEAIGGVAGSNHYTGVWDALTAGAAPLTWLVSGNEGANPLAFSPGDNPEGVELLGTGTSGIVEDVVAAKQEISAAGVPGQSGATVVGHYAWWVGDEGVKAPVALTDRTGEVLYAPFDSAELRHRSRQQVGVGPAATDADGRPVFDAADAGNATLAANVITFAQLAFLHPPGEATAIGSALVREHYSHWSANNFAVLAQTQSGGLRQDLSLAPQLLGPAFAAWANSAGYMEDPDAPSSPAISPSYPALAPRESLRRRYRMTAPLLAAGIEHGIAPVLSYFLITFNIRTDQSVAGATRPLEVRARWMMTFWNPYTSALVPEALQMEIAGLPVTQVVNDTTGTTVANISLDSLYGAPLRIALPWTPAGRDDQQSWLSGRVYTWAAQEDLNKAAPPPAGGFASIFYTRTLSVAAGQGVQRAVSAASMSNSAQAHLQGNATQLTVRLFRGLAGGGRELLRTYLSPPFNAFSTTPGAASASTYQISYVFHLAESVDSPATPEIWLSTPGQDLREPTLPAGCYLAGANGPRPELYPNYTSISFPDRLLDRALPASAGSTTGQSYNEDTPIFELPRGPLLSVGTLQQLPLVSERPFAIGNSWAHADGWNRLFDEYFFSGLVPGGGLPDLGANEPWPNPWLRVAPREADGMNPTSADVIAATAAGYSSKYLLQGGGFNLNSVDPLAWLAVLRSGRCLDGATFDYLDATAATGTQADSPAAQSWLTGAIFFRFSFSAQETYRADAGYAASTTVPPAAPNTPSAANTHLFRRGVRVLSEEQTAALAGMIAALLRQRLPASGPYRSVQEFLDPSPLFGGLSLLEEAIANAVTSDGRHINDPVTVPEFSSQWLTQGDILSLLAPVLFARSDNFLIRAYGDTTNPVTGELEDRAWCEAIVQRLPDFVDAAQPAETAPDALNSTNQTYGRRFKVVQFRWLTSADI